MSFIRRPLSFGTVQRRSVGIVSVILGLLGLSYVGEKLALSYCEQHWETLAESWSLRQLDAVKQEVVLVQRNSRRIAAELARHEAVVSYLSGAHGNLAAVFDRAARVAQLHDVGVEVYDRTGTLIAWHGRSGTVDPAEIQKALRGELTSYVSRGPIYSHLFVITPVRIEGSYAGAILVRKAVEVNYPLSNAFIQPAGLSERFTRELGVNVELTYGDDAEPRKQEPYVSSIIYGIDGRKLGVASILRPSRAAYLDQVAEIFRKLTTALALVLLGFGAYLFVQWWRQQNSLLLRCVLLTLVLWVGRYALLWLEVPSLYFDLGVFDPVHFASKFGWGLAKSVGEMTLTAGTLFLNIALMVRLIVRQIATVPLWRPKSPPVQILLAILLTAFIFFALRGVAAVIRSAVFDSSLRFNDPTVIIPSFELGLMVLNMLLVSFSLIVVAVGLTWYLVWMFSGTISGRHRGDARAWFAILVLFFGAGVILDVVQESPLVSVPFRIMFGLALVVQAFVLQRRYQRGHQPVTFGNAMSILALAAVFFYPVLDQAIHEQDRERVQSFAQELLRPTDAWIKYVVEESLHQFLTDEVLETLMYGTREEQERLAFTCWARSIAARQGYNCSFWLLDAQGNERSLFAIGSAAADMAQARPSFQQVQHNGVTVRQRGSGLGAVKMYSGSIPIIAADSCLGYGLVMISASQQSLFRGATPTVFRISEQENIETFYRPITLVEFRDDSLVAATGDLPLGYSLPQKVVEAFQDPTRVSVWIDEVINDRAFESYFVRPSASSSQIIGLQTEQLGMQWHLFGLVKMLVYYSIALMAAGSVVLLVRALRGRPYRFSFRDKLLIGFLMTAVVPVIIIALYVREFATERVQHHLADRLWQETGMVEQALVQHHDPVLFDRVQSDFNYYSGNRLILSTRPELYNSGILDRRLSGTAYAAVMVLGRRFHMEMENIGTYRYAVGYRPVLGAHNEVEGIVAVPALYRQDDIDRDVAKTNALLFGVYGVVIILVSLVATTLANRIASPIQKLTRATKQVAAGDLDVRVQARADGEIGELIRSFETMTRELKNSRQNLIQYERELAWKEMAKQVAHEIKNPLTPMKLALQHLQQTYRDKVENFGEVFEEVSQMVIRQVDALSRIASEFSHFARMPKPHLEKCNINEVLLEATRLFDQDEQVEIQHHLEQSLPPVFADREELRRAFINIIRNGIQATIGKGNIIISSALKGTDVEIRIRDFGTGIPEDIKHKLFQPNFSTKTDGMGLGLAIVKKTIDDLHGTIEIESEVNKGTTVIIRVPTAEAFPHESASDPSP